MDELKKEEENDVINDINSSHNSGLYIFFRLNALIFGPLILGIFIGRWANEKFGIEPWGFFWAILVSFTLTSYLIYLEYKKLIT